MPNKPLNDASLRSFPTPEKGQRDIWDASLPGFGVRISQGGTKTFILKLNNSRRTIGRYPIISLSEARAEARRLLAEKTLGRLRPQNVSCEHAIASFLEDKAGARRASTVKDYTRLLGRLRLRGQIADIHHDDFGRSLGRLTAPSERNHALAAAKTFFTWAQKRRYIEHNPTIAFSPFARNSRARVLSDDEIKSIWQATATPHVFSSIVRLLLLTGQRRMEIASLQTSWINDDTITLPKQITKNGRGHTFPLGSLALSQLQCVSKEFSGTTDTASAKNSSSRLFFPARGSDTKPFNGWSKSKTALDNASGVTDWTLHDLRRTFATGLAELGTPPHVIERLLNHVSGQVSGVAAIYNRARYLPEMRAAIETWERRLESLLADGHLKAA